MSEQLRVSDDGAGVRTLTLERPEVRNALSLELRRLLPEALAAADDDPAVRVIVVTGAGGHFCSGADIAALDRDWTPAEATDYMRTLAQATFRVLRDLRTPTVARVEGMAVGAGEIQEAADERAVGDAVKK